MLRKAADLLMLLVEIFIEILQLDRREVEGLEIFYDLLVFLCLWGICFFIGKDLILGVATNMTLIVGLPNFLIVFLLLLTIPSRCALRFRWLRRFYLRMVGIKIVHECVERVYFIIVLRLLWLIQALLFKELLIFDVLGHLLSQVDRTWWCLQFISGYIILSIRPIITHRCIWINSHSFNKGG